MHTLFAISILSFFVLVMAGVAIARHIRIGRGSASPQTDHDFAHHLFAATRAERPDTSERKPRMVPAQTIKGVMANKSWNQPPEIVTVRPDPEAQLAYEQRASDPAQGGRKSPQSSHKNGHERLDWAYFNKDLGDLSDPYQAPRLRANSSNNATSPKRY